MAHTALFVIDIQNELASDLKTEIPHAQRIRDAGTALLAKARAFIKQSTGEQSSLSIVFVQHEEPPDEGSLQPGNHGWELVFPPDEDSQQERLLAKNTCK